MSQSRSILAVDQDALRQLRPAEAWASAAAAQLAWADGNVIPLTPEGELSYTMSISGVAAAGRHIPDELHSYCAFQVAGPAAEQLARVRVKSHTLLTRVIAGLGLPQNALSHCPSQLPFMVYNES